MNTIFASATLSDLVLIPSLMICAAIFAQLLGVPGRMGEAEADRGLGDQAA